MARDVKEMDVGDYVQTLDKQWHKIIGIRFHNRKRMEHRPCIGKNEAEGIIRDWSITTEDGLVLGMMECNLYAKANDILVDMNGFDKVEHDFPYVLNQLKDMQEDSWSRR